MRNLLAEKLVFNEAVNHITFVCVCVSISNLDTICRIGLDFPLNSILIIIQCKVHYNVHITLYYRR